MKGSSLRSKILVWRIKNIPEKNVILLAAGLVGILSGGMALILKVLVHYLKDFLTQGFHLTFANYLYLAYPLIGILLTVFVSLFFFKELSGHGIAKILYSISQKSAIIEKTKMFSNLITTTLTVGFGGSVGVEAPVVMMGSAIGSNVGQFAHFAYKNKALLIGCGAAGAISAIFHAPIGGVIFALEVLLAQMSIATFIPLLIASVTGALISKFFHMDDILISVNYLDDFSTNDFPFFLGLSILSALVSTYFTRTTYFLEALIKKINNPYFRAVLGGIVIGAIVFFLPPIYGEGLNFVEALIAGNRGVLLSTSLFFKHIDNQWFLLLFIFLILLFKAVASALTIGVGGSGGFFGPSLFMGAFTGYGFALLMNTLGIANLSYVNFTLVGMCGVLSGMLHAPLTAIFLIAEITNGYTLLVPLMYVSAISFTITQLFEKHSIYTKHLVETGDLVHYDKDKQVLSMIDGKKLIERDLKTVQVNSTLDELVEKVKTSNRNIFPVLNAKDELLGVITLDDIRGIMFDEDKRKTVLVSQLMHSPPAMIDMTDSMDDAMNKFEQSGAWNLPVIENGKYVGFLSKSRIFSSYRNKLLNS